MSIVKEWISFGEQGKYTGFLARPDVSDGPLPAVIVIQEIWGVEPHIQDVTVRFAQAGYVALAPDLYAVGGERPAHLRDDRVEAVKDFLDTLPLASWFNEEAKEEAIGKLPEPQRTQIGESLRGVMSGHDTAAYLAQLTAAAQYLRGESPYSKGRKVGAVGFCMGGNLSANLACEDPELAASVIFYGRQPEEDKIAGIQCPVIGFYGGNDPRITDNVPALAEVMKRSGKRFEPIIYKDAPHAFFNDSRNSYRPEAARDAFAKTLNFFNETLA